jgi:hypothetical protein
MAELRNIPPKVITILYVLAPGARKRFEREAACLTEGEHALAARMGRYDKAHSARMAAAVTDDPVLKKAALLHDVGKSDPRLKFVFRVLYTSLELLTPGRLHEIMAGLESETSGSDAMERTGSLRRDWARAFYAQAHHAALGGIMLERAGSDPGVTALVGSHQDRRETFGEQAVRLFELDRRK